MKHVGLLLEQIGLQSENPRGEGSGISDEEMIYFLNDAQDRLQTIVLEAIPHLTVWDAINDESIVANQRAYNISDGDALFEHTVRSVQFSSTGYTRDLADFEYTYPEALSTESDSYPSAWSLEGGQIVLGGIPSSASGLLRIRFIRALDQLDKRRGKIESVSGTYTSVVLEDDANLDSDSLADAEYVCINSPLGVVTYYNAVVASWTESTRTLVFTGATTTVGTIAVGSYITIGKYTTTHSKLPRKAERYLITYGVWKMLKRDSSIDAVEQNQELVGIEQDIISGYSLNFLGAKPTPGATFYQEK